MASAKKEVVNTFTKGVIMDFNPIITPKSVLTDCLNGTIITYDGNEQQLQNDKGNVALKGSKLPEGYLPVGTSSYGDVLYIVSYNPITKRTQIGTFPSPLNMASTSDNENKDLSSILTQAIANAESQIILETESLANYQKLEVFYNEGKLIINPGDEYNIDIDEAGVHNPYEKLEFFILDDKNTLHNITSEINTDGSFHGVTWQVPGYLAARWRLPQIEENGFSIQPKSINLSTRTATMKCQIGSRDSLIDDAHKNNVLSVVELNKDGDLVKDSKTDNYVSSTTKESVNYDSVNYYGAEITTTVPEDATTTYQTTIAPAINVDNNHILLFDKFKQLTSAIDLSNVFSDENTFVANTEYNYSVNGRNGTIRFNVDCNVVSNGDISLTVSAIPLYKFINNGYILNEHINWTPISKDNVFDGVGQNIVELEFPEEEQMYVLKFSITDGISEPVDTYKLFICSDIMNKFTATEYPDYSKIPFDAWINNLSALTIKIKSSNIDSIDENTYTKKLYLSDGNSNDAYWLSETASDGSITGFVLDDSEDKNKIDIWKRGYTYTIPGVQIKAECSQKYLYNFCSCNFVDSRLVILNKGEDITEAISEINISGNIVANCYVEQQYKDQGTIKTSGASINLEPAFSGRKLLYFLIEQPRTSDTTLDCSLFGYDVSDETCSTTGDSKLQPAVWTYKNNGSSIPTYDIQIDNNVTTINAENIYYKLYNGTNCLTHFSYSGSDGVDSILSASQCTDALNNYLKSNNIACCPIVFDMHKNKETYVLGISKTKFQSGVWNGRGGNNDGDGSKYLFGVIFRTKNDGVTFVPISQFARNGQNLYKTDYEFRGRFRTGWDFGFQRNLMIKAYALGDKITAGDIELGRMKANRYKEVMSSAESEMMDAAREEGDDNVYEFSDSELIAAMACVSAVTGAVATANSWNPVGWLMFAASAVLAIVSTATDEDAPTGEVLVPGPFVTKCVYDVLFEFCNKLQVNRRYAEFEDGYFLNRTLYKESVFDSLSVNYYYKTKLKSFTVKHTGTEDEEDDLVIENGSTFEIDNYGILTKNSVINWNKIRGLENSENALYEYKLVDFTDLSKWPYTYVDIYKNVSVEECSDYSSQLQNHSLISINDIENKYSDINLRISEQSVAWPSSLLYNLVGSGQSIGFYLNPDINSEEYDKLYNFIYSYTRSTTNSDSKLYDNKNVTKIGDVCLDASTNMTKEYWAFLQTQKEVNMGTLDFENKNAFTNHPRFRLMLSENSQEMSIYNLLNKNLSDEIDTETT